MECLGQWPRGRHVPGGLQALTARRDIDRENQPAAATDRQKRGTETALKRKRRGGRKKRDGKERRL